MRPYCKVLPNRMKSSCPLVFISRPPKHYFPYKQISSIYLLIYDTYVKTTDLGKIIIIIIIISKNKIPVN